MSRPYRAGSFYDRELDPKWTVLSHGPGEWGVYSPGPVTLISRKFPTHADAIAYAQAQARKES